MKSLLQISTLYLLLLLLSGCEEDAPDNPYDNLEYPTEQESSVVLDKQSIEGLHRDVFLPTCANSGCHDGSFEPDFRTIQSTYNTTVGHLALKADPSGNIDTRVKAGDANNSMLVYRMTENLPNSSGIMPLNVEPDSDWPSLKEEHIANVRAWINAGAKNMIDG